MPALMRTFLDLEKESSMLFPCKFREKEIVKLKVAYK